jgi:hypothetical protein
MRPVCFDSSRWTACGEGFRESQRPQGEDAADQGIAEEEALKRAMEEKSREFVG